MFTYDLSTNLGKVRAVLPDTVSTDYVFEDAEIEAFLSLSGNSVWAAVAALYETLARDRVRGLKKWSDGVSTEEYYTAEDLLAAAAAARRAGLSGALQSVSITQAGNGLDEFRPLWRTIFDKTLE